MKYELEGLERNRVIKKYKIKGNKINIYFLDGGCQKIDYNDVNLQNLIDVMDEQGKKFCKEKITYFDNTSKSEIVKNIFFNICFMVFSVSLPFLPMLLGYVMHSLGIFIESDFLVGISIGGYIFTPTILILLALPIEPARDYRGFIKVLALDIVDNIREYNKIVNLQSKNKIKGVYQYYYENKEIIDKNDALINVNSLDNIKIK